ncbi:uncharacterized protein LOC121693301 isoform X1 [Alosa sapidissima]|uniref:uncharacterized protein LOC121693301 isoform X1 n=2 Tax=Alosa sapidissima TaxID=34773 RepID=UPI001C08E443|nr:uncharacterized protein LOC121693301 isoform X1 [Alosa sapidissima]
MKRNDVLGMELVSKVSECVSPVLSVALALYECYNEVQANKERCGRLVARVQVVESVVRAVKDEDVDNEQVRRALADLQEILSSALELVRKHRDAHWCKRAMKANDLKEEFGDLNERLSQVSGRLALCLQLEVLREVFEAKRRQSEDQRDAEKDQREWREKVLPLLEGMDDKVDQILHGVNNLLQGGRRENKGDTVDRTQSESIINKNEMDILQSQKLYETSVSQYKAHVRDKFGTVQEYNSRPGADYVVLTERYTDLVIVQKHREQREREEEIRVRGRELLHRVFTRASKEYLCTSVDQLFSPSSKGGEAPRAVILQGHSGYGKSFTAQKIIYDWASGRMYQDSFDLVFHLKGKELNNMKEHLCLVDLLLQHDEIDRPTVLKVLQEAPHKVLFLIDGFDELRLAPEEAGFKSSLPSDPQTLASVKVVLAALLRGKMLRRSSLLVTTRSTALKALSDMLKEPQRFTEILGFSDRGVETYFRAFFAREENPAVWKKALRHVKNNETLLTACFIPVTCWIVCNVFKDVFKNEMDMIRGLDTSTSIFAHFVFTQMKHHGADLEENEWSSLLRNLGQLAEDGILKQQVLFDERDVKQLVSNHHLVPFLCKFFLRKLNVVTKYSFMHLSFQEFFAALFYLLSGVDVAREKVKDILQRVQQGLNATDQKLHMSHLLPVIQFLFGFSNQEVTATHELHVAPEIRLLLEDWIHQLIKDEEGLPRTHNVQLFILQCLYEIHEEDFVRTAMGIWNKINLDGVPLKRTDCSMLAFCVRHCSTMERLTLTHCNLTAEKLKVLVEALAKSAELGLVVENLGDEDVDDLTRALGQDKIITDLHLKNSSLSRGSVLQVLTALTAQRRVDTLHLKLRVPYENAIAPVSITEDESGEDVCGSWTDTPPEGKPAGLDITLERKMHSTDPPKGTHTLTLRHGEKLGHAASYVSEIFISQLTSSERFSNTWTHLIETIHTLGDSSVGVSELVDTLQSSLLHIPDVNMVDLKLSCMTVEVAAKILLFFQACPTLHSGRCKQAEDAGEQGGSLCSDLSLRRTSDTLQLNVKHLTGDLLSDVTLVMATPSEESEWTTVFLNLSSISGLPEGVDLSFLHAVRGLQRLMLQVTCLTDQWATALVSLVQTPLPSCLEYCSLRVAESDLEARGDDICSFLSVETEDSNVVLMVEYRKQLNPLREAQITDVALAMSHSQIASFHFHNIHTLRELDAGTPEFVEQVSSVPGLQKIKLILSCLTENWAATLCSLIKNCPTLTIITVDAGEGGERLLLEEGVRCLQDGVLALRETQSPQLTLTLTVTGRRCAKAVCADPEDWGRSCNRRVQLQSCALGTFTHTHLEEEEEEEEEEEHATSTHTHLEDGRREQEQGSAGEKGGTKDEGEGSDGEEGVAKEEEERRRLMNSTQKSPTGGSKCCPSKCELQ